MKISINESNIKSIIENSIKGIINERIFNITLSWVKQMYDKYNNEIWNNQLPPSSSNLIEFKFSNSTKRLGAVGIKGASREDNGYAGCKYGMSELWIKKVTFYITTIQDFTDKQFLDTIIHEMCHVYECFVEPEYLIKAMVTKNYSSIFPKDGHGKIFYEQAKICNSYGFNVQKYANEEASSVAAVNNNNNGYYIIKFNCGSESSNYFCKVKSSFKDSFIEKLKSYKSVCKFTKEIKIYRYNGNSGNMLRIPFATTVKLYYWNNLTNLGLDKDLELMEIVPCEFEAPKKIDIVSWMKQNKDYIFEQIASKYFKKYLSSNKVYPEMSAKIKIDNFNSLPVTIGIGCGDNYIDGLGLRINNFTGDFKTALYNLDNGHFFTDKTRNNPDWKNVELALKMKVFHAIENS